ncbi:MAG: hypothetical protein JO307_00145 [Bryobacterales bacterium]|nr:hypothetical protein [Bryobacterales bacterium]MBV9401361.1 hypothetical protein [Bryobacterales bacterium]
MGLLTISGEPASCFEGVAHATARLLGFDLVDEDRISQLLREQFGGKNIPDYAWRPAVASAIANLAKGHHLVLAVRGAEAILPLVPGMLRAGILSTETRRIGAVMLERRLERPDAIAALAQMDDAARTERKARFGRAAPLPEHFDIALNAEQFEHGQMAEILRAAAGARCLREQGFLPAAVEAKLQFQTRLELARHGIVPVGQARLKPVAFGHPSEEVFANLLDFYSIHWEYEPRSFPLQWDKDGNVAEAFTPDFYLPEFDIYVELTTMKQTLVTRKNRKIKLLRAVYPHVNIQVFYQKDFQDLIFKYGLRVSA